MKDIYENLVIGNFLFGLGAEMARRHLGRCMPETLIANLQQMPMDACYADVMIKNPGVFRIIEFKREARRRRDLKEAAKLKMIEDGMRSSIFSASEVERLGLISRTIHWYVETPKERRLFDTIRVTPYLSYQQIESGSDRVLLADFVRDVANEASMGPKTEQSSAAGSRW